MNQECVALICLTEEEQDQRRDRDRLLKYICNVYRTRKLDFALWRVKVAGENVDTIPRKMFNIAAKLLSITSHNYGSII
ncbi:hypothetical protein P5V15_008426 [Pogonomyrmex californicus]